MAALHGGQIVEAVGQRQCLRVGIALVKLLHAAVDVAQHRVNLANNLAVQCYAEVKYTVSAGVLRTYVYHIVIGTEDHVFLCRYSAVGLHVILRCVVSQRLVSHTQRVLLLRLVVLAHGITNPVLTEEDAAHIRVAGKDDAIEVVGLALIDIGDVPKVAHGGQHRLLAVGSSRLEPCLLVSGGILHAVNHAETALLAPVHTDEVAEVVKALGLEPLHLGAELRRLQSLDII